jgi:phosphoribosylaminoimidazolecarboxamide formyltransferase/IMP cyclohydrolase
VAPDIKIFRVTDSSKERKKVSAMTINTVERIDDRIGLRHMLVSVSDKRGLDAFVPELLRLNPGLRIFSTGGTFSHLEKVLGRNVGRSLVQVSDYTGQPETQGGLVKTLDFKIYLGLLTETYNEAHQADLVRTQSVPIDMVVVNLYPFRDTVAKAGVTVEAARGNIDIGGPCMIRAAAKNFIRVASVVDPSDYPMILSELNAEKGSLSLRLRFRLAQKAFVHTAAYDHAIADYLGRLDPAGLGTCYRYQ